MKAMLLAAGLGTRLKPFTDNSPKALAVVNGKTLLQRNIEYLQQFDIHDVIVNVHHFADQIVNIIQQHAGWGSNVSISDETNAVLETGGGLKKADWYFSTEEDFVLMNVDILSDLSLHKLNSFHKQNKPLATLATTNRETSRYFLFDEENILCGWINKKTHQEKIMRSAKKLYEKAFSGIHVISSSIFQLMPQQEEKFSMVDVYLSLCSNNTILSFDHSETKLIDVGKPESLEQASIIFK